MRFLRHRSMISPVYLGRGMVKPLERLAVRTGGLMGNWTQSIIERWKDGALGTSLLEVEVARAGGPPEAVVSHAYQPPRVIVIGKIRDVTTGSSSSGNKDANSQYYW
jgi:hypothetical protein